MKTVSIVGAVALFAATAAQADPAQFAGPRLTFGIGLGAPDAGLSTGEGLGGGLGGGARFAEDRRASPVFGVGHDWAVAGFVLGLDVDTSPVDAFQSEAFGKDTFEAQADWFTTVRARAGSEVRPGVLFYGTGGYARLDGSFSVISNLPAGPEAPPSTTTTTRGFGLGGYAVGLGAELALGGNASLRVEYLRAEFGDDVLEGSDDVARIDPEIGRLSIGLVARF